MASELERRTASARESLKTSPPAASPSWEQCNWCPVKHLCDDYWTPATQTVIASQKTDVNTFVDAQLKLENRLGPKSFAATLISGTGLSPNSSLILSGQGQDQYLTAGKTIRVLSGTLESPNHDDLDDTPYKITLNRSSERFFLD